MYDRTALRAAAERRGDTNANRMAERLCIPRTTAYRLWGGTAAPSASVAAAVHRVYRVRPEKLLVPQAAPASEPAA